MSLNHHTTAKPRFLVVKMPYFVVCKNCNYAFWGISRDFIHRKMQEHKKRHKKAKFVTSIITYEQLFILEQLKHSPKFWDAFNTKI